MARSTENLQPEVSAVFDHAVETLRVAQFRPEIHLEETPAPKRLAAYAHAVSADVFDGFSHDADDDPIATGRLVLLYDPAGQDAWHGEFRLVTYVRASLDPEMGADPLLLAVAWTWMTDALNARDAPYTAANGTVTRVASQGFGGMADEAPTAEVEIRASWTPLDSELTEHVLAWGDALAAAAGLLPLAPGIVALPQARTRRAR